MKVNTPLTLLGGLTPEEFMRDYWQKKPLLVRGALPGFKTPITAEDLQALATRDEEYEVESRLIWQEEGSWNLERGPFEAFPGFDEGHWTLLVQNMDVYDDRIAALMRQFSFIPTARLDDVMISFATLGGGVGPHFDSYDVFLIQGEGQRRWRYGRQEDKRYKPGLPCRILEHFTPEYDEVLEPGDMLYLPPQYAHDGVAETERCVTISVGYRTQSMASLVTGTLEAAIDQVHAALDEDCGFYGEPSLPNFAVIEGNYQDPEQPATLNNTAEIPPQMLTQTLAALQQIVFDERLAARYLGVHLSETRRADADFEPSIPFDFNLLESVPDGALVLDYRSKMLYAGRECFVNGECFVVPDLELAQQLANTRQLSAEALRCAHMDTLDMCQRFLDDGWAHWQA